MSNKELKLEFIENGRLTDGEMGEIVGGAVSCPSVHTCATFEDCGDIGKRKCTTYANCGINSKTNCGSYNWMNLGFDLAIADISSSVVSINTPNVVSIGSSNTINPLSI